MNLSVQFIESLDEESRPIILKGINKQVQDASLTGDIRMIKLYTELLMKYNLCDYKIMFNAAYYGYLAIVKYLSEINYAEYMENSWTCGCSIEDFYPIIAACKGGHPKIIKYLLECYGPNVEELGELFIDTPFMPFAISSRSVQSFDCVKELHRSTRHYSFDCSEPWESALFIACYHGKHDIAKYVIDHNIEKINRIDESGRTALHCIVDRQIIDYHNNNKEFCSYSNIINYASEGHNKCIKLLLDCGIDASIIDNNGSSAANYAHMYKYTFANELLHKWLKKSFEECAGKVERITKIVTKNASIDDDIEGWFKGALDGHITNMNNLFEPGQSGENKS